MRDSKHYQTLPYTTVLKRDEDGDVVARVVELPGCSAHGNNEAEALENLAEAKQAWIEDAIDSGDIVPEPEPEETLPSGKWVQRVPRSLHAKLVSLAKQEGVSLNQFVTSVLAESAGRKQAVQSDKKQPKRKAPASQVKLGTARKRARAWS